MWGAALFMTLAATAHADSLDDLSKGASRGDVGDHTGAIELDVRAHNKTADLDVLVLLGNEQGAAGKVDAALVSFCTYLALEPSGDFVDDAKTQVVALNANRGLQVDATSVCAAQSQPSTPEAQRMLPGLTPPAQRMLPGLTPPAERMLPPTGLPAMQPSKRMSRRDLGGVVVTGGF